MENHRIILQSRILFVDDYLVSYSVLLSRIKYQVLICTFKFNMRTMLLATFMSSL